uniref:Uncharacterized protein n=1 Tax=Bicosoecida sp. CB-2014 TaxID=1486930 RepID=A0A7S1G896_9STRA
MPPPLPPADPARTRTRAASTAARLVAHGDRSSTTYLADMLEELRVVATDPATAVSEFRALFNAAVGGLGGRVRGCVVVGREPERKASRTPAPPLPAASSAFAAAFGEEDDDGDEEV